MNISKSLAMQDRARHCIPGETQLLSKRPSLYCKGVWPSYFSKAEGTYVWDLDGNKYLDMSTSGIGACTLGYANPQVNNAVKEVIDNGSHSSLNGAEEVILIEKLCELHPWANMGRLFRTGGEALAAAVRIARAFSKRDKIMFCGYHGWHDWYVAANLSDESNLDQHLVGGIEPSGVPKGLAGSALPFEYNNCNSFTEIFNKNKDSIGAVIMEPIRNFYPTDSFRQIIREATAKAGIPLIIDEVSAGFRTRCGGAHIDLGFEPDLAVFSKALGNGFPIAAVIGQRDVMMAANTTFISSTFWTERIGPAAALATIATYESMHAEKILNELGTHFQKSLRTLAEIVGIEMNITGLPALTYYSFKHENAPVIKSYFTQEMLKRGFISAGAFYPNVCQNIDHIESFMFNAKEIFTAIRSHLYAGNLESKLEGEPSQSGFKRIN
jgi:glutamate-1-semialdehyde 2,1-aminomutase